MTRCVEVDDLLKKKECHVFLSLIIHNVTKSRRLYEKLKSQMIKQD